MVALLLRLQVVAPPPPLCEAWWPKEKKNQAEKKKEKRTIPIKRKKKTKKKKRQKKKCWSCFRSWMMNIVQALRKRKEKTEPFPAPRENSQETALYHHGVQQQAPEAVAPVRQGDGRGGALFLQGQHQRISRSL